MTTRADVRADSDHDDWVARSLVNGRWIDGHGDGFRAEDPAAREPSGPEFRDVDERQVTLAVELAAAAFDSGPGFSIPRLLRAIAEHLESEAPVLISTAQRETGLGNARLVGELARTTRQLRSFAEVVEAGKHLDPILDVPTPDRPDLIDMRRSNVPLGPVAVWTASNFPFAFGVAGGDTASALAAGCPVIVKAHPSHPATSSRCAAAVLSALNQVGAPAAWFAMLQAATIEPGISLATHEAVAALAFTGSERGGRALFDAAARRPQPIPVYAEMGSLNPIVITPAAATDRGPLIAHGLAASLTSSSGQLCTKPGLILTLSADATSSLVREFTAAMAAQAPGVMLNERLRATFANQTTTSSQVQGVQVLLPPTDKASTSVEQQPALLACDSATFRAHPELAREHFGPFAVVVVCQDEDDLYSLLREQPGSLTGSFHTGPDEAEMTAALSRALSRFCGRVIHNGYPTGVPVGWATVHSGPYPASTAAASTSVGMTAVRRFQRPVALQAMPDAGLTAELQDANPLGLVRLVNGQLTSARIDRLVTS